MSNCNCAYCKGRIREERFREADEAMKKMREFLKQAKFRPILQNMYREELK
ncbi:hypothetical protein LCGC14_1637270 [marine sediment metagenome]|uniref:Uncharacterized protein n=1 Tax=marine sediment metagenome TaxID=412755 RepID=A0A0F9IN61_9ZZZZ